MDFAFTGLSFYRSNSKSSLAKVHRTNGDVKINLEQWNKLPEAHKVYVLCHEEGHYLLGTKDELEADQYASKKYLQAGYLISESVKALSLYLNENNPVHYARVWAQYQRALQFDHQVNRNSKAARPHYESVPEIKRNMLYFDPQNKKLFTPDDPAIFDDGWGNWDGREYYGFLGIGGSKAERKQKRAARVANRVEKRALRNEAKKSRIEARKMKSQAGLELAKQGIVQPTTGDYISQGVGGAAQGIVGAMSGGLLSGAGGGIMDALSGVMGNPATGTNADMIAEAQWNAGQQPYYEQDTSNPLYSPDYTPPPILPPNPLYPPAGEEPKNKTGMWIGIIAGAAALTGLLIFLISKNK